jgi:TRAP-type C4-dicarboxylate transport system permease small subunit
VLLRWLERAMQLLLCATIFLMMAITAVDVFARYVLSAPLRGAFEIVTLLLATSTFIALPMVTRAGEHIRVDLLAPLLRGAAAAAQRIAILVISAAILAGITVQLWKHAGLLARGGQVTGFLEWPLAPLVYLMSAMCGVTVLVYVAMIVELASGRARPRHSAPGGEGG